MTTLPRQRYELQLRDCCLGPTQPAPPFAGAGLLHSRFLYWYPPHRLLHLPYLLQEDQWPSTEKQMLSTSEQFPRTF